MYGISSEQYCINSSRRSDYIGSGCAGLKKHLEKEEERRRLRVRLQRLHRFMYGERTGIMNNTRQPIDFLQA